MFINTERINIMYTGVIMGAEPGKMAHKEEGLLQKVLEVFYNTTGLRIVVETIEPANNATCQADALVHLIMPGANRQFAVEIKPRLTQAAVGMAVHQLERLPQQGLIVTDYE